MLKAAPFRTAISLLLMLACAWKIIDLVALRDVQVFPNDGRQPGSLYAFLGDMKEIAPRIPKTGVVCYAGRATAGLSPRLYYLWTLYALAPRILVPWGNRVHEDGPGLRSVAPSLLWSGAFDETACSYLLVQKLDEAAPPFMPPGFGQGIELRSGNIDMVLYTRQTP